MRKKMIAMLFVLILTLSGCADVSTAPEESDNYELVTETEAAAETESTESSSFSESKESESAKTDTELERNAEVTEYKPVESETSNQNEPVSQGKNQVSETKPAVTEPPGELMYSIMSFSGFSLSNNSICATTRFATISSIGVPRKIILSLKSLEKMSKDLSPRDDCSITTGTKLI